MPLWKQRLETGKKANFSMFEDVIMMDKTQSQFSLLVQEKATAAFALNFLTFVSFSCAVFCWYLISADISRGSFLLELLFKLIDTYDSSHSHCEI